MECTDAKLRMEPYATGNLSSPDREAFEAHVEHCEGCRLELELTRAMSGSAYSEEREEAAAPDAPAPQPERLAIEGSGEAPGLAETPSAPSPEIALPDAEISFADVAPPEMTGPSDLSMDALLASAVPSVASEMPTPTFPPPEPPLSPPSDPLVNIAPAVSGASAPGDSPPGASEPRAASSWNFEPADAKPRSAPPEGSLFFAQEALTRTRDEAKRKNAMLKTSLWIAGGLAGVALLAFAGWIALRPHSGAPPAADVTPPRGAVAESPAGAPESGQPGSGVETPPVAPGTAAPSPTAPGEEIAAPPTPPETAPAPPQEAQVVAAGSAAAQAPLPPAPSLAPPRQPASPPRASRAARAVPRAAEPSRRSHPEALAGAAGERAAKHAPAESAPRTVSRAPASGRHEPGSAGGGSAAAGGGATTTPQATEASRDEPFTPGTKAPAPGVKPEVKPEPAAPAPSGDKVPAETGPAASSAPPSASQPPAATAAPAAGTTTAAAGAPPAAGASPGGSAAPGAGASESAPARPIDRIHAATVAAEERSDLGALRTLRDRWKLFIQRTGVGPDRTRAKREMADCLWAIQSITARRSDQREALQAYRDYILNSPAGGADSRSISRARQLEDALSESR